MITDSANPVFDLVRIMRRDLKLRDLSALCDSELYELIEQFDYWRMESERERRARIMKEKSE